MTKIVLKYFLKEKKLFALSLLCFIFMNLIVIANTYIISLIFNVIKNNQFEEYKTILIWQVVFFVLTTIFVIFNIWLYNKMLMKVKQHLRTDIIKSAEKTSISDFYKKGRGSFVASLKQDFDTIFEGLLNNFYQFIFSILAVGVILVILFTQSVYITLITIAMFIPNVIFPFVVKKVINSKTKKIIEFWKVFGEQFLNFLEGFPSIFFLNKKYLLTQVIQNKNNIIRRHIIKEVRWIILFEILNFSFSGFISICILTVVAYFVYQQKEDYSIFIFVYFFEILLVQQLAQFLNYIKQFVATQDILKKYSLEEKENEEKRSTLEIHFESIEIKNLNFSFDKKVIFKDFNFKFEKGKKYAITGPSGAGKSTLISILLRQIPLDETQGSILLNGKNYQDIDFDTFKNSMTFLDSKEFVFNTSIYNNVSFWEENQEDRVEKALEKANYFVDDIWQELNNLDSNLSTGQKQRINIARHFYRDKKLLILDEALANLDKENASKIKEDLFNDKELTLIHISHHIEPSDKYDYIIKIGLEDENTLEKI
ncbi:ATP-binding cassette domain-containing protein [Mycoplasma sp. 1654_15]|uniref:ATP-binding cassette domain-containing protein n=1 Tax=Mycoplasma sp. 1654_15 TaxID=2725994 RepID=UPI001449A3C9|nr:ABC transporter ATP-binding protein [Mycoplasma sp. 1654_15]QJB71448.1 ABC transporter ATP-binding protein [Mycoplasma sp. 1654_15]